MSEWFGISLGLMIVGIFLIYGWVVYFLTREKDISPENRNTIIINAGFLAFFLGLLLIGV